MALVTTPWPWMIKVYNWCQSCFHLLGWSTFKYFSQFFSSTPCANSAQKFNSAEILNGLSLNQSRKPNWTIGSDPCLSAFLKLILDHQNQHVPTKGSLKGWGTSFGSWLLRYAEEPEEPRKEDSHKLLSMNARVKGRVQNLYKLREGPPALSY